MAHLVGVTTYERLTCITERPSPTNGPDVFNMAIPRYWLEILGRR